MLSLIAIVNADSASATLSLDPKITVFSCPDYFGYVYGYSQQSSDKTATPAGYNTALQDASGNTQTTTCTNVNTLYNYATDMATRVQLIAVISDTSTCGNMPIQEKIPLNDLYLTSDLAICNFVSSSNIQYIPWTKIRPFCPGVNPYP